MWIQTLIQRHQDTSIANLLEIQFESCGKEYISAPVSVWLKHKGYGYGIIIKKEYMWDGFEVRNRDILGFLPGVNDLLILLKKS